MGEFPGCGEDDVALVVGCGVLSYADVEVFWGVDWGVEEEVRLPTLGPYLDAKLRIR